MRSQSSSCDYDYCAEITLTSPRSLYLCCDRNHHAVISTMPLQSRFHHQDRNPDPEIADTIFPNRAAIAIFLRSWSSGWDHYNFAAIAISSPGSQSWPWDRRYDFSKLGNCEEELPKKPVGRLSADTLPTVYRQVAYISGKICWPSVGQHTADSRPTVGRQTADSWPTVDRQVFWGGLLHNYPKLRRNGDNLPTITIITLRSL